MSLNMKLSAFTDTETSAIKKQYNTIKQLINIDPDNIKYYSGYIDALEFIFGEEWLNTKDFIHNCSYTWKVSLTQELLDYFIDLEYNVNDIKDLVDKNPINLYCTYGKISNKQDMTKSYYSYSNLELFKAVAAMRRDSDYMQWFIRDDTQIMVLSQEIISPTNASAFKWRKASIDELKHKFCTIK